MIGTKMIKLRLKAFESNILDKSVVDIVGTLSRINANFYGPIPMPRKVKKFTVNRGANIDKKSMEQFEIRSHSRMLVIERVPEVVEALMKLQIASGVGIQIKLIGGSR
jgi:small subunit ribosomal protein S10